MAGHLSIGEVLTLLQAEFPDVTISKIRFLEAQGLLVPERTPSGYRKFHEPDVERLRWILTQQRENFLPLKVIKDRLAEEGAIDEPGVEGSNGDRSEQADDSEEEGDDTAVPAWMADLARKDQRTKVASAVASNPAASRRRGTRETATAAPSHAGPPSTDASTEVAAGTHSAHSSGPPVTPLDAGLTTVTLTAAELASAAGIDQATVADLEHYGLIASHASGNDRFYDADALIIAQKAAAFLKYGVEARHLRMYKQTAEREAALFEQVVMPMLKQRNPAMRSQALDLLGELALMGQSMRAALLRTALRGHFDRTGA